MTTATHAEVVVLNEHRWTRHFQLDSATGRFRWTCVRCRQEWQPMVIGICPGHPPVDNPPRSA
jgi:hypothetical protein